MEENQVGEKSGVPVLRPIVGVHERIRPEKVIFLELFKLGFGLGVSRPTRVLNDFSSFFTESGKGGGLFETQGK